MQKNDNLILLGNFLWEAQKIVKGLNLIVSDSMISYYKHEIILMFMLNKIYEINFLFNCVMDYVNFRKYSKFYIFV